MALDQYPALAWPLMHAQLTAAQADFLAGDCAARPADTAPVAGQQGPGGAAAPPPLLGPRFAAAAASGEAAAGGGSTDAAVRLTHLLKAMAAANNSVVESKARDWVPLFLAFTAASPTAAGDGEDVAAAAAPADDDSEEDEEGGEGGEGGAMAARAPAGHLGLGPLTGRFWRSGMREWLALLGGLRGARGMHQWETVQVGGWVRQLSVLQAPTAVQPAAQAPLGPGLTSCPHASTPCLPACLPCSAPWRCS